MGSTPVMKTHSQRPTFFPSSSSGFVMYLSEKGLCIVSAKRYLYKRNDAHCEAAEADGGGRTPA